MRTEHGQEILIGFKMIALRMEHRLADTAEEFGEQSRGPSLGGALAPAASFADGDEALLELRYLSKDLGHLVVQPRVAAVAESVEVAFGRARAGAAAAPVGVSFLNR